MADEEEFDETEQTDEGDAPAVSDSTGISQLRKHLKNVNNENQALKLQLEQLLSRQRAIDLTDIVRKKNLPPKIIDVIPDNIDLDGVEQWLDDHSEIFKPTAAARRSKPPTPEQAAAARETTSRMSELESSSQLTSGDQAMIAQVNNAASQWKTVDDMRRDFHEWGAW